MPWEEKLHAVAYINSNCEAQSGRAEIMRQLMALGAKAKVGVGARTSSSSSNSLAAAAAAANKGSWINEHQIRPS